MMIKKSTLTVFIILMLLTILIPVSGVTAAQEQGQINVTDSTARMDFPLTLNFSSRISSNADITDIRLRYRVDQMSFAEITSEGYVNFTPGRTVNAIYALDLRRVGGLPPGADLTYWWAVRDASGGRVETTPTPFQVTDNRYNWRSLTEGKVVLYWYEGSNAFAQSLMATAQEALVKLAKDTGAVPERPIEIYIYANAQDLQGSMIFPQEWTGGVAFTQFSIIAIGISPNDIAWGQRAMAHELTHNVISQEIFNPYNDIPVWLSEGLAMHTEGELSSQFTGPLRSAIRSDSLISVRSLSSPFSAYADTANLSYAESATIVEYLIEQYGADRMLALLKTFKQGSTYDGALQTVYGFNMDGLNNQWQTWVKQQYGD